MGRPPAYLEIRGETRTVKEWQEDPKCPYALPTVYKRMKLHTAEEAIFGGEDRPGETLHEAFSTSKTLVAWSKDKRCRVAYQTLWRRIKDGWDMEQALTVRKRRSVVQLPIDFEVPGTLDDDVSYLVSERPHGEFTSLEVLEELGEFAPDLYVQHPRVEMWVRSAINRLCGSLPGLKEIRSGAYKMGSGEADD